MEIRNGKSLASAVYQFYAFALIAVFFAGCGGSDSGSASSPTPTPASAPITYKVVLVGAQENPPVLTAASGTGTFALNTADGTLTGSVTTANVAATMAHLHTGAAGTNGPVSIGLTETAAGSGVWAVPAGTRLTSEQLAAISTGGMYANVHSVAYPGGQVRGQVGTEVRTATMTGTQENPAVTTNAKGTGILSVDPVTRALVGRIATTGIVATMAHIHTGAVGTNGPVIVPLTETSAGSGIWVTAANTTFDAQQYADFLAGNLYFNVHSTARPGGEIRGQIGFEVIDVPMTAVQEVPANTSTASATARILLNPLTLSASGTITTSGMTTNAAHIHTGNYGANGPVTFPFTVSATSPSVYTMAAATLTTAQYQALLAGDMYTNAHSAAFPGGEVRGQIGDVIRTGVMTGAQEVPANTSTATGRGFGRFNPVTLEVAFTATSTVVNPTVAHLHTGAAGANGPVTIGFTQTSPGVWTSALGATMTPTQAAAFAAGGTYYNIHSAAFPGGEVRGQATGRE